MLLAWRNVCLRNGHSQWFIYIQNNETRWGAEKTCKCEWMKENELILCRKPLFFIEKHASLEQKIRLWKTYFQLEYLNQALTNRVRTKSSQTHQRFKLLHRFASIFAQRSMLFHCDALFSIFFGLSFRTRYSIGYPHICLTIVFQFVCIFWVVLRLWPISGQLCTIKSVVNIRHWSLEFDATIVRENQFSLDWNHRFAFARVDNPTQMRVRRWSFYFKELLSDPTGVREFMKFCEAEFSTESLSFYLNVQAVRNCSLAEIKEKADIVYR